jgi:hypothetical protein
MLPAASDEPIGVTLNSIGWRQAEIAMPMATARSVAAIYGAIANGGSRRCAVMSGQTIAGC